MKPGLGLHSFGIRAHKGAIDITLIDCPPSLGLLTINALGAATEVFIPVQTQFFALQGMSKLLLRQFSRVQPQYLNPAL